MRVNVNVSHMPSILATCFIGFIFLPSSFHCFAHDYRMHSHCDGLRAVCICAGVSEQQLPQLVEEQIEKNRRQRERQTLKKQGVPPRKRRRPASEANEQQQSRSHLSKAERRRREQASRVDDGELGPGFVPRRPPR